MKKLLLLLIILFVINSVSAASISGFIYDLDLQLQTDVKITIDTIPEQIQVSKDGTYSFEVPPGTYNLKAEYYVNDFLDSYIQESITISDDGNYKRDLILFSNLDIDDDDFEPFEEERPNYLIYVLTAIVSIAILLMIFMYRDIKTHRKNKNNDSGDLDKVIKFIKKEDGRTTQKDIRKALGLSEAKASLIVTELEHKKIIKRIKKGRGNIIILNK